MCDPPLFDDFQGIACADGGGQPRTGYAGCTFIGGYDRVVISRCDAAAGIALNMVLVNPSAQGMSTSALSLPAPFALEYVAASASTNCPTRGSPQATVTSISGTVTWADLVGGAGTYPAHANIDVTVTVQVPGATAPLTATLRAQNVDVRPGCN